MQKNAVAEEVAPAVEKQRKLLLQLKKQKKLLLQLKMLKKFRIILKLQLKLNVVSFLADHPGFPEFKNR